MLKSFRIGGIHPKENKLSAGMAIQPIALPAQVVIPLSQHIGAPCQPIVKKGDKVKVGTLIGKSVGFVCSDPLISFRHGTEDRQGNGCQRLQTRRCLHQCGGGYMGGQIDRSEALVTECNLSAKEILEKIATAGIVGMGGATFPTHVKLTPHPA